jgi:hypothetical protein
MRNLWREKSSRIKLLLSLVGFIALFGSVEGYLYFDRQKPLAPMPAERASLVQLLTSPQTYDGHRIQAAGYFVFKEENHALYLSVADAENYLPENSIDVVFDYKKFNPNSLRQIAQRYVSVTGIFHAQGTPEWPGAALAGKKVHQISSIEEIRSPPYQYDPRQPSIVLR